METVQVVLTQGKVAIIDAEDADRVLERKWSALRSRGSRTHYATTSIDGKTIYLHRFVTNADSSEQIDHEDLDGLNCTKRNLRRATNAQNNSNKTIRPDNTSGFKGVYWSKVRGKWMAYISVNGKRLNLGYYEDLVYAARVYDQAAREHHGEFARLNFPGENIVVETSTGKKRNDNRSGYRGVSLDKRGKWVAQLSKGGSHIHISRHETAEAAARAYNEAALFHLGDKAVINTL